VAGITAVKSKCVVDNRPVAPGVVRSAEDFRSADVYPLDYTANQVFILFYIPLFLLFLTQNVVSPSFYLWKISGNKVEIFKQDFSFVRICNYMTCVLLKSRNFAFSLT
jgi:hypothetical protein